MSSTTMASAIKRNYDEFNQGDIAFVLVAAAMVLTMVPGLGFLYAGLSRRKSALHMIAVVMFSNAVTILQWLIWGYSLGFSSSATNPFIGNLRNAGLTKLVGPASPGSPLIPEILYSLFQMEFAAVTVAIMVGGAAERGRVFPLMIFSFMWITLVYCPLAHWVWATNGWAFKYGVLDFAGGGPVEIASGFGGLAYALALGRRRERELLNFRPHNVGMIVLGTALLWFGWLGFNGGSAFGANFRAIYAVWNSMIAASLGGMIWVLLDYRVERKWSVVGFCSGTIAGLVAATPSSGFVPFWASVIIGALAGFICNFATKLKFYLRIDDAFDVFAEHAVGGIVGLIGNALFGTVDVIALDGVNASLTGGWLDHNYKQLYIQIAYICATVGWSFVVSYLIARIINVIPGLHLRTTEDDEILGIDDAELGEFANDYIEVRRHFHDWTPVGPDGESPMKDGVPEAQSDEKLHWAAGDRHGAKEQGPHLRARNMHGADFLEKEKDIRRRDSDRTAGSAGAVGGDRHGGHGKDTGDREHGVAA